MAISLILEAALRFDILANELQKKQVIVHIYNLCESSLNINT